MKVIVVKDYEEMSQKAFEIMASVLDAKEDAVIGLATGTTPIGLYSKMIEDCKKGRSYAKVKTANLDEYYGIDPTNEQSYVSFMKAKLFDHIDIEQNNTHIELSNAKDAQAECDRYTALLEKMPRDIQVLGIGSNGHVGFNEPNTPFGSDTHVVELTESTIKDNSRLFNSIDEVPTKALTMGIKQVMQAKKIILLANGKNKAKAIRDAVKGKVDPICPASILQLHPDVTFIVDEDAASLL